MGNYDDDDDDRESVSDGAIMFGWCLVAFLLFSLLLWEAKQEKYSTLEN
jgi:hypothetical protein